jgi:acetylornithine/N-succinyldiaminopimelate aminotransferase
VRRRGEQLAAGLHELAQRHRLGEVRANGLLQALELGGGRNSADVVAAAQELGLLLNAPRPHCLRFMPALNVSEAEIVQMLEILDAALRAVGRRPCIDGSRQQ